MIGDIARIITDAVLVNICLFMLNGLVLMIVPDVPLLDSPLSFMARHSPADCIMVFMLGCPRHVHGKLYQNVPGTNAVDISHCFHLLPHCKQCIWNMYGFIPYCSVIFIDDKGSCHCVRDHACRANW